MARVTFVGYNYDVGYDAVVTAINAAFTEAQLGITAEYDTSSPPTINFKIDGVTVASSSTGTTECMFGIAGGSNFQRYLFDINRYTTVASAKNAVFIGNTHDGTAATIPLMGIIFAKNDAGDIVVLGTDSGINNPKICVLKVVDDTAAPSPIKALTISTDTSFGIVSAMTMPCPSGFGKITPNVAYCVVSSTQNVTDTGTINNKPYLRCLSVWLCKDF